MDILFRQLSILVNDKPVKVQNRYKSRYSSSFAFFCLPSISRRISSFVRKLRVVSSAAMLLPVTRPPGTPQLGIDGQFAAELRLVAIHRDAFHDRLCPALFHYLTFEIIDSYSSLIFLGSKLVGEESFVGTKIRRNGAIFFCNRICCVSCQELTNS